MWELSFSVAFSSLHLLVFTPRVLVGPAAGALHRQRWWRAHQSQKWMWKRDFFFNCILTRGRTNGSDGDDSGSWGKCRWLAALSETQSSHNKPWPLQPQERRFHFIFFLWAKPWGLYSVSAPHLLVCQSKSLWLELSKSWELGPVLADTPLVSVGVSSDSSHCRAHFLLWFGQAPEASIPLLPQLPAVPPTELQSDQTKGLCSPTPRCPGERRPGLQQAQK